MTSAASKIVSIMETNSKSRLISLSMVALNFCISIQDLEEVYSFEKAIKNTWFILLSNSRQVMSENFFVISSNHFSLWTED